MSFAAADMPGPFDRVPKERTIQLAFKRLIDVVLSAICLILACPLLAVAAVAIRVEDGGPILFRQVRIGAGSRPFGILKLRTIRVCDCDERGLIQVTAADPRLTRVGRLLRKTNLDEIPQLWNVLAGDMSLVGPRPHVPGMLAAGIPYEALVDEYQHRHRMRPGLTGLAQSRGLRGPTDDPARAIRRIRCDIEYIREFSLALDFRIMIRTALNELRGGTGI
ncbi:MAG: sugar transferase [Shinella sp.]|nr:sugar transferase [Shinella sp.]